jgi:hypothetical protein
MMKNTLDELGTTINLDYCWCRGFYVYDEPLASYNYLPSNQFISVDLKADSFIYKF